MTKSLEELCIMMKVEVQEIAEQYFLKINATYTLLGLDTPFLKTYSVIEIGFEYTLSKNLLNDRKHALFMSMFLLASLFVKTLLKKMMSFNLLMTPVMGQRNLCYAILWNIERT